MRAQQNLAGKRSADQWHQHGPAGVTISSPSSWLAVPATYQITHRDELNDRTIFDESRHTCIDSIFVAAIIVPFSRHSTELGGHNQVYSVRFMRDEDHCLETTFESTSGRNY
jgi:hypothetical protein